MPNLSGDLKSRVETAGMLPLLTPAERECLDEAAPGGSGRSGTGSVASKGGRRLRGHCRGSDCGTRGSQENGPPQPRGGGSLKAPASPDTLGPSGAIRPADSLSTARSPPVPAPGQPNSGSRGLSPRALLLPQGREPMLPGTPNTPGSHTNNPRPRPPYACQEHFLSHTPGETLPLSKSFHGSPGPPESAQKPWAGREGPAGLESYVSNICPNQAPVPTGASLRPSPPPGRLPLGPTHPTPHCFSRPPCQPGSSAPACTTRLPGAALSPRWAQLRTSHRPVWVQECRGQPPSSATPRNGSLGSLPLTDQRPPAVPHL
ncbi:collagen alpha-1(I) chain-like [Choloepus didactylus]|uniref:collagen alpha-1(I) chain-like n=1 Tax=Choloepus didactylus TaxID=27675 RepID=UPI00189EB007|nr:collagen alpha-1(I) chain-like [Choloepus didactylus]